MKRLFKRIFSFFIAVVTCISILITNVFAFAPVLTYSAFEIFIPIIGGILCAAGIITADQIPNLDVHQVAYILNDPVSAAALYDAANNDDIIDQVRGALNVVDTTYDVTNDMVREILHDWMKAHQNNLQSNATSLNGHGAAVVTYWYADTMHNELEYYQIYYADFIVCHGLQLGSHTGWIEMFGDITIDTVYPSNPAQNTTRPGRTSTMSIDFTHPFYEYEFLGDIRDIAAELVGTTNPDLFPTDEVAAGEIVIDGIPYPINPDGSITIDGVTYFPNPDGSITITNNAGDTYTYYPTININNYDNAALIDLINQLLNAMSSGVIMDEPIDNTDTVGAAAGEAAGALDDSIFSNMSLPNNIVNVFPFCIPFDFVRGIKLLAADPIAPHFEIPFNIPSVGVFRGYHDVIIIDFQQFDTYFKVVRWGCFMIFALGLCFVSFKIVKGV